MTETDHQLCDQSINTDATSQPDFAVSQKKKNKTWAVETSNLCTLMLKILNIPHECVKQKRKHPFGIILVIIRKK